MFWKRKKEIDGVRFTPLRGHEGFILDMEGQKIVGIALEGGAAKEIAGGLTVGKVGGIGQAGGVGQLGGEVSGKQSKTDQKWLIVTNMQNPLLRDYDRFVVVTAKELSKATGSTIRRDDLVVSIPLRAICENCGNPLPLEHTGPCPKCGKEGKRIVPPPKEELVAELETVKKLYECYWYIHKNTEDSETREKIKTIARADIKRRIEKVTLSVSIPTRLRMEELRRKIDELRDSGTNA